MSVADYKDPRDRYRHMLAAPTQPCPHGNGENCECQLPIYGRVLFVLPIEFDGKKRHVVGHAQIAHDGGMRQLMDPISGEIVGSCGLNFWIDNARTIVDFLCHVRSVRP